MSSSSWINLDALWKIIVFGLLLGAGLPALFAVGLRALSIGQSTEVDAETGAAATTGGGTLTGRVLALLCFAIILAAIAWGIYSIVNQS
jgi:hypothetical protein